MLNNLLGYRREDKELKDSGRHKIRLNQTGRLKHSGTSLPNLNWFDDIAVQAGKMAFLHRIYQYCLTETNVEPEQALFIDDNYRNIR